MILIVGLGNPGKKYESTRHNIGFRAVDEIAANFQFPIFLDAKRTPRKVDFQSIFNAQISKKTLENQKIILAKPQALMNNSGKAVRNIIRNYKLEIRNLVVVHDDADLPLGEIRISIGRGTGGHKGVESIIRELKTKDFVRFRVGIKPNLKLKAQSSKPQLKTKNLEKFVLKKFTKDEEKIVKEVIQKTVEAIKTALEEGLEKAMNKYN